MTDAAGDADVEPVERTRASWERLGLPGLIDVHAHFLPPPIERAVWRVFDEAGPLIGREWPIRYRQSIDERVALLRSFGVRRFTTLPYAHKPGVATFMNDWSRDFAAAVPEAVWSGTFYPEPGAADYVSALVDDGVEIFKLHQQVGGFHLDDPLLNPVWDVLADVGTPVLVHAGSGPVGTEFTGPASMARLLAAYPRLTVVVAHLGAPECVEFARLAARHDRVYLDTSMAVSPFFGEHFDPSVVPMLADLQPRVLWGSDFPTLPFPYVDQLDALAALDLGDDWLRDVLWHNAAALIGSERP
ncbi:amidohydrolase family protein [Nocardioides sp.]|uniref:amidohydrolase family protein n=1 Tax=Nocardioides sp. TaxID=35761 RepID=UPI002722B41D|nr:amidohydrolase family protein [Nocardioides sp.]MDO9457762.1 amidohydrolase family protein [Nocardioides sp.]